ncbi:lysophospholipid acyltransferase family protein [Marinobacter sp. 2_MG-2023]|uniref:lysophospholipid acyltransferase family protein n=1 Tax=Marinobacter sp. 2_MG-2023 TaxID=3062679 RepID=UPI0026E235B7|nr:lysophospholipid acyltransferase family protein [Marinobacter sp. 2_MG-2023]MDO6443884.1 lysophospholipid acyltransferase family protein [Marinobacter sp. 2_MG-2023]
MKKLKSYLLKFVLRASSMLNLKAAQHIGRFFGGAAWKFRSESRRVTDVNLELCLTELDKEKRDLLSHSSLRHTGMTALEIPLMWEWPVQKCLDLIQQCEGVELVEKALSTGNGLILLAPHIGNWELAGLYFSSKYKMASLYSPPNMKEFEDYMIKVRSRVGAELVRGDRRGLMRLMSILKEGGVTGILPDQSPRGKTNAYAPFFGTEVRTMTLVAKLMQKTGANALVTYAERLPSSKGFRIVVKEAHPDLAHPDPVVAATALNKSIESVIRLSPEQYQWEYKRLRHRPKGEPNPYYPDRVCRG